MNSHFTEVVSQILKENHEALAPIDEAAIEAFLRLLEDRQRIFVTGEGRSGLVMRMFAMRLTHLGRQAYVVGDVTTPAIASGDLLVVCSGSGETAFPCLRAERAAQLGATVIAICGRPLARLSQSAALTILISPPMPNEQSLPDQSKGRRTVQFGGSRFEQSALLFCDIFAYLAMERWGVDLATMQARHANLE